MTSFVQKALAEGWGLREFALSCAKGMATMHEFSDGTLNPQGGPVAEDPYYAAEVEKARTEVRRLESLEAAINCRLTEGTRLSRRALDKTRAQLAAERKEQASIQVLLAQVETWDAPANLDCQGLKRFMLEQLKGCWDVTDKLKAWLAHQQMITADRAFADALTEARLDVKYALETLEKHQARVAACNAFLVALRTSLPEGR